jgi:hypothetical protein
LGMLFIGFRRMRWGSSLRRGLRGLRRSYRRLFELYSRTYVKGSSSLGVFILLGNVYWMELVGVLSSKSLGLGYFESNLKRFQISRY